LPVMPATNHAPGGTAINDSLIIITGGYSNFITLDDVWIYNTNTQTYFPSDSLPAARNYHSMVNVDSCVYSVGGYNPAVTSVEISLIKNCTPQIITSISASNEEPEKPYTLIATSTHLSIYFNSTFKNTTIRLMDVSGRIVWSERVRNSKIEISNENFSDGMYFVLLNIEEHSYSERWIVSR